MAAPRPMLEKLRSRHPVDLPAESWGRRTPFLAIIGGIAGLFLILPLGLSLIAALVRDGEFNVSAATAIAAGFGFLFIVLLVAGIRGKVGHDR